MKAGKRKTQKNKNEIKEVKWIREKVAEMEDRKIA